MYVACNVYVSAGAPQFANVLTNLLRTTQEHCHQIKENAKYNTKRRDDTILNDISTAPPPSVVVVHAFCDGPYDRSSFHLAGSPTLVADAASALVTQAIVSLENSKQCQPNGTGGNKATPHPTVGLVDHVSVLPLPSEEVDIQLKKDEGSPSSITGMVAQHIGASMSIMGVDVLYYGYAHPDQVPLATVRREKTQFFQSGTTTSPIAAAAAAASSSNDIRGQATVGAPEQFTENFNIRLKSGTPKSIAQSLTRHVRERDGTGLPFVEALTLPYSHDRYEVACNLLHPEMTSANDIVDRVASWESDVGGEWVETSYRVGTTAAMCHDALERASTEKGEQAFNEEVVQRLKGFLAT